MLQSDDLLTFRYQSPAVTPQCLPVIKLLDRSRRRRALRRAVGTPVTASAVALAVAVALAGPAAAGPLDGPLGGGSGSSGGSGGSGDGSAVGIGTLWGDSQLDLLSLDPGGRGYDPRRDPSSLYSITTAIGARGVWSQRDARGAAITGKGVTVAVLDSGVAPVAGLSGKLVQGPDLSLESNSPQPLSKDSFGHGTHMASIIGAADAVPTTAAGTPLSSDGKAQLGVAPGAQLLALKLANSDGSTDVSQVIAAIDWVVEHRRDNGMNVRVINLSYGTDSQQDYRSDPLAAAVERAWQRGIVVVASAGNDGPQSGGLNDPAYDPYVLAVGSTSPDRSLLTRTLQDLPLGSVPTASLAWGSSSTSEYTSRGTSSRPVDLAAPGRSVVGLAAGGSTIDREHPEGRVSGDSSGRLLRGSGTSQAAAVVSGAAALLLQADPTLTPDAVKAALTSTAQPVSGGDRRDVGAGQLDVRRALGVVQTASAGWWPSKAQLSKRQAFPTSTGLGSLDAARGGFHLVDPETGQELRGEVDVQGRAWDGRAWRSAAERDATWSGGYYLGERWSGDTWASGTAWAGARWSGARWSGARWSSVDWDGARWSGARWSGARWSSSQYDGARWS